jgi:hypothetical protein
VSTYGYYEDKKHKDVLPPTRPLTITTMKKKKYEYVLPPM